MDQSMLDPLACGFGVAFVHLCKINKDDHNGICENLEKAFCDAQNFLILPEKLRKILPTLTKAARKWSQNNTRQKRAFDEKFDIANWEKLSKTEKNMHTIYNCSGCYMNPSLNRTLSTRPFKNSKPTIARARINPKFSVQISTTQKEESLKMETQLIYNHVSTIYERKHNINFGEALSKHNVGGVEIRKGFPEKRREKRDAARKFKKQIEETLKSTALER